MTLIFIDFVTASPSPPTDLTVIVQLSVDVPEMVKPFAIAVLVRPAGNSAISTPVALPPKLIVIFSIALPENTVCDSLDIDRDGF